MKSKGIPQLKGARGIGLPPLKKTFFHVNAKGTMSKYQEPVTFKEDEKFSTKEMKTAHSLIVLSSMMADKIDDFGVLNERTAKVKEATKTIMDFCESMLHNVYKNSEKVSESTYIQELASRFNKDIDDNFMIF